MSIPGLDLEGRRLGPVEHVGLADDDLDLARRHVRVLGAGRTAAHHAGEQHDPLRADLLGGDERLAGRIGVEGALHDAGAVSDVDEDEAAVIASLADPPRDLHDLADVARGQ